MIISNVVTKVEYQYFYTKDKKPRVTVCYLRMAPDTLHSEPWTALGIAICSLKDNPCKRVGRNIAYQRARWAAENNSWGLESNNNYKSVDIIEKTDMQFDVENEVIWKCDVREYHGNFRLSRRVNS